VTLFLRTVGVPEPAIHGMQQSPFWVEAAVAALPDGVHRVLPGQTHDVDPTLLAAAVTDVVGLRA